MDALQQSHAMPPADDLFADVIQMLREARARLEAVLEEQNHTLQEYQRAKR